MHQLASKALITKILQLLGIILITTCVFSMSAGAQGMPKIGDNWAAPIDSTQKILLPPPHGIRDKIVFEYQGIRFSGGVLNKKIVCIMTSDPNFQLRGSKYIGSPLSSFKNKDEVKLIRGWANFLLLSEGWYAAFDFKDLSDSSKVLYLFKKEDHL